jgi:hypothetical protein
MTTRLSKKANQITALSRARDKAEDAAIFADGAQAAIASVYRLKPGNKSWKRLLVAARKLAKKADKEAEAIDEKMYQLVYCDC